MNAPHPETRMAAPRVIGRNICNLAKIFSGTSISGSRALTSCRVQMRGKIISNHLPLTSTVCIHTNTFSGSISPSITVTEEPDTLYQKVTVLVKCHDRAVLDSYEFFVTLAAKELGITLGKVFEPPKDIERFTLLKSIHIFKKHRVQYEMRTHYRSIELRHLTGSTAQVFLEYIQRNLPEGVAMDVTKTSMEKIPEHILEPMWKNQTTETPGK